MTRRTVCVTLFLVAALCCGGGDDPSNQDVATDVPVDVDTGTDTKMMDDPSVVEIRPEVLSEDTMNMDPGLADEGIQDPGQPDPGTTDPGKPDPGPPTDTGPQYSDTVLACIYVVENICAKMITKCDFLGLIPAEWMEVCTDFLLNNGNIIAGGCQMLDDTTVSDPNIEMIKTFGPSALKECTDNFECTLQNIGKLGDFILPLIQGEEFETADILALVADLCFK
ncbi:MAG: hypothetical protein ISR64_10755 [Deltaproteobacteria bacterium]|nr:hypothetical protein [Deltaproteobacteria bacterium]